ncbi:nucleotidyl transferase AbiEii/AbiGii toxin family protein [Planococcus soli]|uniref:nucleotidyl transferase AbiEii/AbiGii toxin family protein n=1 Tax=Planococcus soli TaxID=2666072 RepID=UPI00115DFD89|nr:nucleotidyl transferase AbiEii/AbiGii toxin family protein [Planococcus soli]
MIATRTFESEWIKELSIKLGKEKRGNPELIEKVTKALHLLELLSQSELSFIFKGGTSLLLLLDNLHRFSIDIDIIVEKEKNDLTIKELERIANELVAKSSIFYEWKENERKANDVPKSHYKFYYKSAVNPSQPHYILLDVLFESSHYEETVFKSIKCEFIDYEDPEIQVNMPTVESILGDKLTAFAPLTTGIPYAKGKELEIIKQLFDIENLFDEVENLETVERTFSQFAEQELRYRNKTELSIENVLEDIFNTSLIICAQGSVCKKEYAQLQDGVNRIKDFIFSKSYLMRDAVVSASKAAYLAQLILKEKSTVERFNNKDMSSWKVDIPVSVRQSEDNIWRPKNINNVKKSSPEAYFYIYKALELNNQ